MQEKYYCGGIEKDTFSHADQPPELYATLKESFPWVKPEEYFSISTVSFHTILEEDVITCCLPQSQTAVLVGPGAWLTTRKFCMQSKTSFLRSYELYEGQRPDWMPSSGKILFVGNNHQELGRPYPAKASTFVDIYFSGDPDDVEKSLDLPVKRGAYETFYGVTAVDGKLVRAKQYCYEDQNTFSDWDVAYLAHCKALNRTDLLAA